MQEPFDAELLRQYAEQDSESAFAALVTRHVNLVYSAAVRKTHNPHAAEEITQAVFIILARKARSLRRETVLPGWLYQTARLTAANFLRNEIRRVRREQESYMQSLSNETGAWPQIEPLLDDAMGGLNEKERNAVVLHFFEGKSFQEIGAAFGGSENAAKKRVIRGLEKLRKFFAKRGVDSTAATIAETISTHSVQAVPVTLTKSVTAVALAKGATASASTLTLIKGALKIMAWTKAKTGIAGVIVIVFVLTATTVVIRHAHGSRSQTWTKNQLSDAGYATPEAAMKTLLWGISHGDADAVAGSLTPTERANAQRAFPGQFSATVEAWSKRMSVTNFQIAVEGGSSDNVTIDLVSSGADGQKHERKYWFKKIGKEWKCDQVHPSFDLTN
jgi:RNA polymerase sigma factor (sigma-70 family)